MQGKIVVSQTGCYLGLVRDVYFDEGSGEVRAYELATRGRDDDTAPTFVSAEHIPEINDVIVLRGRPQR